MTMNFLVISNMEKLQLNCQFKKKNKLNKYGEMYEKNN